MDIGLIPATITCASQEVVVDFQVYNLLLILYMNILMKTREVGIVVMDLRRVISVVIMVTRGEI